MGKDDLRGAGSAAGVLGDMGVPRYHAISRRREGGSEAEGSGAHTDAELGGGISSGAGPESAVKERTIEVHARTEFGMV